MMESNVDRPKTHADTVRTVGFEDTSWVPGATVGRYALITPIATGGMAQIWLARQLGLHGFEKIVVVKRMVSSVEADPDHIEMFFSEARLAAQLNHPNIVQIFELGEEAGAFFIAMEFVDGESLSSVSREAHRQKHPIPLTMAAQLIAWAAEGLHYAHTQVDAQGRPQSIIHRDVSPQNLLVTYTGGLKVVDFGIAKVASQATQSGKLKGKLAYMSPEQGRGESLDARSDVFALGVVLFELVTGGRLFPRAEELEILQRLTTNRPLPHARERNPDLPEALDAIIARALEPHRERRWATARDLQLALEAWVSEFGQRVTALDVAAYLNVLFAERVVARKQLLDAARRGELAPSRVPPRTLQVSTGTGSSSRSGSDTPEERTPKLADAPVAPPPRRWLPIVLGAGVLGLGLGGAAIALHPTERPPPSLAPTMPAPVPTPPPAAPLPDVLSVTSTPPGATVFIDDVERSLTPSVLTDLTPGDHMLRLSRDGYEPQTRVVHFEAPGARTELELTLVPRVVDAGLADAARARSGRLSLSTTPWSTVFLGTRKLGDTPLVNVTLPQGKHVLTLVNDEDGIHSSVEVEIVANTTTVKKLRLQEP
jgi:serine/threonine-protein kinase